VISKKKTVIFVAGPTGSGKTTLVKSLSHRATAYIEDATRNPYFGAHSTDAFDAEASQKWFLDKMAEFLQGHTAGVLAIDQHPRVVSRLYGAVFSSKGLLSDPALVRLDRYADRLVRQVTESAGNVLTVWLSASTPTLWARLRRRKRHHLTFSEVVSVNRLASSVVFPGPCLAMNTEVMSVQREKGVLEAWLSDQRAIILDSKTMNLGPRRSKAYRSRPAI
jgi:energy-coupling factor transporter ATP-binding protein EcfA2